MAKISVYTREEIDSIVDNLKITSGNSIKEVPTFGDLPPKGIKNMLYITTVDNNIYRWTGTRYEALATTIQLGETSTTAYAGSKGAKNRQDINKLQTDLDQTNINVDKIKVRDVRKMGNYIYISKE